MTDAMSKLLAGLHIEQTETQQCNNEASLYNERGQWIAEVAYADAAEAMVAAVNEHDALVAKLAASEARAERDTLRAEVERLREAIARWLDSLDCLYSTNDLRGTDYFDYELKSKMEDEMRAVLDASKNNT